MNIKRLRPDELSGRPTGILRWEAPPPKPPNRHWALEPAFRALQSSPGKWGLLHIYPDKKKANSAAGNARTSVRRRRMGTFEVVVRTLKDRRVAVYARCVEKED